VADRRIGTRDAAALRGRSDAPAAGRDAVRKVLATPGRCGYTSPMTHPCRSARIDGRAARFALVMLAVLVGGPLGAPQAAAQPRDRVTGTLPALQAPERGERVLGTRALREAGEARFRDELVRQAELDALFNPHRAAWGGASMPIYPAVVPPFGTGPARPSPLVVAPYPDAKVPLPCAPGACPPPKPSPRPPPALGPYPVEGGWGSRHRGP
jgi:hypothetical protein